MKYPLLLASALMFSACGTQKAVTQRDLSKWDPASENMARVEFMFSNPGTESSLNFGNQWNLMYSADAKAGYDVWSYDLEAHDLWESMTPFDGDDFAPVPLSGGKEFIYLSDQGQHGYYKASYTHENDMLLTVVSKPAFGSWVEGDVTKDDEQFVYPDGKVLKVMNLRDLATREIGPGTDPSFTVDGDQIIHLRAVNELNGVTTTSIWIVDADGTDAKLLVGGGMKHSYSDLQVSPEGGHLLYTKHAVIKTGKDTYELGPGDLWMCEIDGTKHVQLTTHPLNDSDGAWRSESEIFFVSERPLNGRIDDASPEIWRLKLK